MKQYIKWIWTIAAILAVVCFLPSLAHAQGPDPDAPIDGGLSLLLAAGVGYGVKKIKDSRKKTKDQEKI